jgi:hypothetical protein
MWKYWSIMKAVEGGQRQLHGKPPEELVTNKCIEICHSRRTHMGKKEDL